MVFQPPSTKTGATAKLTAYLVCRKA